MDKIIEKEEVGTRPMGRAAIMEMYRAENPDVEGDPDEDALWGFAHDRYSGLDGKYKELSDANVRLAEQATRDPRLGAVLSMLVGENAKSFPYAVGRVYGKEVFEADDDFEKGYQENLAQLAESKSAQEEAVKNLQTYFDALEKYKSQNGLTDEQADSLNEAIYNDAANILMGIIPEEFIDYKWKGMNYDKDIEEAAITGEVEGRNQAIEVKKKKMVEATPIPDLGAASGGGRKPAAPLKPRKGSFFDALDESTKQ